MSNIVNYIFNSLDRTETEIRTIKKVMIRNDKSIRKSLILSELSVIALCAVVYSNCKKIEELENEIKELKGE